MKSLKDIQNNISNYGLTDNEKLTCLNVFFQQLREDIVELKKPEVATLWGTLIIKSKKAKKHITMIDKILETPIDSVKDKHLDAYREKKKKLENILSILEEIKTHGKTHRSKKRCQKQK